MSSEMFSKKWSTNWYKKWSKKWSKNKGRLTKTPPINKNQFCPFGIIARFQYSGGGGAHYAEEGIKTTLKKTETRL